MPDFKLTPDQKTAARKMTGKAKRVMLEGGARSGKTFEIIRLFFIRAMKYPGTQHCIGRLHFTHLKSTIIAQTWPTVNRLCFPDIKTHLNKSDFFYQFPNGSQVWLFGLDQKERMDKILGSEWFTIYLNEASLLEWDHVTLLLTRLAAKVEGGTPRLYLDQNPPAISHWTYKVFHQKQNPENGMPLPDPDNWEFLKMNPAGNLENLAEDFLQTLQALPERRRKRFLDGDYAPDVVGALWNEIMIDKHRVDKSQIPAMKRIVIAIDPATTHGEGSDETGIIVEGQGTDDDFYILADLSGRHSPAEWASIVATAYYTWNADKIIAETNQGGELVESNLKNIDPNLPIETVHAKTGKVIRAEPVAALYEQGRCHHVGQYPELEDQMVHWTGEGKSPDRLDAKVYATKYLSAPPGKKFWYA